MFSKPYLGINIFENVPNHLGDGCQIGDYIYVPLEYWGGCGDFVHYGEKSSDHFILKINKKDLSLEQAYKIEITEISGIGTDGKILYIVSYCDGSKIWIYDFDGNYIDFIPLSQPINNIQGIAVDSRKNEFYVSCDLDKSIYKFDLYGNLISKVLEATENITLEGLDIIKNKIYILIESYPINSLPMQIIHIFKIKE